MTSAKAFAGVLIAFLVIDILWIGRVVRPMYDQQVGGLLRATPQFGAAAIFYVMYAAGIVYFAVLPALQSGGTRLALLNGAILGGLAYGTYAFTNYAVLQGWTLTLVVADVVWGIVLTAVTAACGLFAARLSPGATSLAVVALLPLVSAVPASVWADSDSTDPPTEERSMTDKVLFAFEGDEGPESWMIVNDGVMGGLSRSRIVLTGNDTAVFAGEISLANNGGFASVRSRPGAMPTAGTSRLAVRVRGDGREYQLRIRTEDAFDGVAYRWNFKTRADEWMTLEAPYRDFVPTFRGRILRDVPPIDPAAIRQFGFLIADKEKGPFRLEVDWVKVLE